MAANTKSSKSSSSRSSANGNKSGRCWSGYEPVKGKKPYSKGSCRKK